MGDTYYPEYDPTPYGGGFDLEDAYGKSYAPSDKSCYAPSVSHADPDLSSLRDDDDKLSAYGVEVPDLDSHNSTSPEGNDKDNSTSPEDEGTGKDQGKDNGKDKEHLQLVPANDGRWTSNYPVTDSDLVHPCPTCGMPIYCSCACNIFHFYNQEEEEEQQHEPPSPQDVANKVAEWLFSSSYI